ncbi:hypothetical protein NMG60_11005375 [Bertholletia excelsa]
MEADVVVKHQALNPCCVVLKEKYSKLEATRNALRQGVKMQNEMIDRLQSENINLKKACEERRVQVDIERQEKEKEIAIRASLENEISALKSEIRSLQEIGGLQADVGEEVILLRKRLSEGEREINLLKELVEKEQRNAGFERRRAEAEKEEACKAWKTVEAEKGRADEERRLADIERKKTEESKLLLKKLKIEADELRSQLVAEKFKFDKAKRALKAEVEEQKKLAEMYQKSEVDEKCGADNLTQQLDEHRQRIEKLQEVDELAFSRKKGGADEERRLSDFERKKTEEGKLLLEKLKIEADELRSQLVTEKFKFEEAKKTLKAEVEEQRKLAEMSQKRATDEKCRADNLTQQLEEHRQRIEKLQEVDELVSSRKKSRADEERRLVDIERKKTEGNRLLLEKLKIEADELRSKLVAEKFEFEEAKKMLKGEVEEQQKLADISQKKAADEKCRADNLTQQLEEYRRRIEQLQEEDELVPSRKLVEAPAYLPNKLTKMETAKVKGALPYEMSKCESGEMSLEDKSKKMSKMLEAEKQKVIKEKKRADSEMRKAEEHRKTAEANEKRAIEEKHRADQLALDLENNRRGMEALEKKVFELTASKRLVGAPAIPPKLNMNSENVEIKLLKKQLKFEKRQVKHAKQVANLEISRNKLLKQELHRFKQELVQFLYRLDVTDKCTGNFFNTPNLNLMRELSSKEPDRLHLHCDYDLVQPNCAPISASDCMKQMMECGAPLHHFAGGNCTKCISGIDSKMEPLQRGFSRKMLESSAINSCTASFSDGQLLDSQEKGAFSVAASTKLAEMKSNSQTNISSLSAEVTKVLGNEKAVGAENRIGSPIHIDAIERKGKHGKKRKRILSAVKSIEHLYAEGKKWNMQIEENLSMLRDMLNPEVDKSLGMERHILPNTDCNLNTEQPRPCKKRKASQEEEVDMHHLSRSNESKDNLEARGGEKFSSCTKDIQCTNVPRGTDKAYADGKNSWRDSCRNLGNFEDIVEVNYMKLLELDNAVDEECYREAIQRPLSPTIPVIKFQRNDEFEVKNTEILADDSSYVGFYNVEEGQMPSSNFDVVNVEIESNKSKFSTCETSLIPLLHGNVEFLDHFEKLENSRNGKWGSVYEDRKQKDSCAELGMPDLHTSGYKERNSSCPSVAGALRGGILRHYVLFSDNNDFHSISRIFSATRTCMDQCSMVPWTEFMVKILLAISKLKQFKVLHSFYCVDVWEKACVFFSLLLHNFSGIAVENLGKVLSSDFVLLFDSLARCMSTVVDDVQLRSMLAELCLSGGLLTLIEDFLIERRVLVYGDRSSELLPSSGSRLDVSLNGTQINLARGMASRHQLMAAGILLASVSATIGYVGFLCETSYTILRMKKLETALLLNLLHVFAYICGSKYFVLEDYRLTMTVVKSLVTFLEKQNLSSDCNSCPLSMSEVRSEFPSCTKCPFSVGAVSMDDVVSLLLENLQRYALSDAIHQDPVELVNSLNARSTEDHAWLFSFCKLNYVLCQCVEICNLYYVLCQWSWDWTCNNIIYPLLKLLESCILENCFVATVVLLGKVGRHGVEVGGYEDTAVEKLRCGLFAFLCQNTGRKSFPTQLAILNALLGLLSLNFEELLESSLELPAVISQSDPADCLMKWYSTLNNEQQSLLLSFLQSSSACSGKIVDC